MDQYLKRAFAVMCAVAMIAVCVAPAAAQSEVKEKPPMYTYVGNWAIPRAQWGEMEKANTADQADLREGLQSRNDRGLRERCDHRPPWRRANP
jgi:hypothetical protein